MTGTGPKPDRNRNDLTNKTGKENGILAKMCTFSQKNEKFRKFLPKKEIKNLESWLRKPTFQFHVGFIQAVLILG